MRQKRQTSQTGHNLRPHRSHKAYLDITFPLSAHLFPQLIQKKIIEHPVSVAGHNGSAFQTGRIKPFSAVRQRIGFFPTDVINVDITDDIAGILDEFSHFSSSLCSVCFRMPNFRLVFNIVCAIFKSAMLPAQAKRFPITAAPCKKAKGRKRHENRRF